jgi:hypothetical protein
VCFDLGRSYLEKTVQDADLSLRARRCFRRIEHSSLLPWQVFLNSLMVGTPDPIYTA